MRGAGQGGHFPVREMRCEHQRRLAVVAQLDEALLGRRIEIDMARAAIVRVMIPDAVEMGEFDRDPPEIVPDAGKNFLDLASDFSGKAIRRLSRPILCSRSLGPTLRIRLPAKSDILCGSVQRSILIMPTAALPSTASRTA